MDIGRAFSYVFEDTDWIKKVLIGGVLFLIPIVGWLALSGWTLEIARRVVKGDPNPLPDWSDFGLIFSNGAKAFLVGLVPALPMFIITLPAGLAGSFAAGNEDLLAVVGIVTFCANCLALIYSLLLMVYYPAAFGMLAATDDLGRAVNPAQIIALVRSAPGTFVIAALATWLASLVAGLGMIACFVGVIFTYPYAAAVIGHLYGQAYMNAAGSATMVQA
jgi:thiamine transporter ThiT